MKILYLASVRIPNEKASGLAIMRQCLAFAGLGHTVTLLRPYRINRIREDAFTYYAIPERFSIKTMKSINFILPLGPLGFLIARISQMIASLLYFYKNKKDIDVIYSRDPWMLALFIFFKVRKPIIWEAHQKQKGVVISMVAKNVTKIICISHGLCEYYKNYRSREDIIVEPSGVDVSQFENLPSMEQLRKKFNLPNEKKIIGYIGKYTTMGEEKGIKMLIVAFSSMHRNNPLTHLLIVGLEKDEENIVQAFCIDAGLREADFTLHPLIQKEFAFYVKATDILVMNYPDTEHYRMYMSPTKLFAYMGSLKLIVTSDLPSIREIVDDRSVLFVKPDDQSSLEAILIKAITMSESESREMCKHAFDKVQKFSWNSRARRIVEKLG